MQCFRQTADVVMRFDGLRLFGLGAGGFNHVGVNRSLGEPFDLPKLLRLTLEHFNKFPADDFALLLRIKNS